MDSNNISPKILVGTVGYQNLRDYSIGPALLPRLLELDWPETVAVEELNWSPVAIMQNFEAMSTPYERVVLLSARATGRAVGSVSLLKWCGGLPPPDYIHNRMCEAVTGVISVDNLLILGEYFGIWPREVFLVDVEPGPEEAGATFTPEVTTAIPTVLDVVRSAALGGVVSAEQLSGNDYVIDHAA